MLLYELVCEEQGQSGLDALLLGLPSAFGKETFAIATAKVLVEGQEETLVGFREPGASAPDLVEEFKLVMAATGADLSRFDQTTVSVGGKELVMFSDAAYFDQDTYVYAAGDVFMAAGSITRAQAEALFAALP